MDGSKGAALGAGIGAGIYQSYQDAYSNMKPLEKFEPTQTDLYNRLYLEWKALLESRLNASF